MSGPTYQQLVVALRSIADFRDETNEWDAVEVCMPEMRRIARNVLAEVDSAAAREQHHARLRVRGPTKRVR